MDTPARQLLAYRFAAGAAFEGQLLGAVERLQSGGALRVADLLFCGRDPDDGEPLVLHAGGPPDGAFISAALTFRLDAAERRRATERTLADDASAPAAALARSLEPGEAVVALLVEHRWHAALDEAAGRAGGRPAADRLVGTGDLATLLAGLADHDADTTSR